MYKITDKRYLTSNIYLMDIEAPRVAKSAKPGQFIIIRNDKKGERIPLTIADYDRDKGTITIVFQTVGAATRELAQYEIGDYVEDFAGPLGQPSELIYEAVDNLKGKNILFLCVLLVMMIPTEVILLPLYRLIVKMDLINNMWGIILPYLVVPMLVFFFRQYLMGIPKDFLDAARVDGCTEYGIFFKIMIPLMKPSFAAMGIYQGMQSWNNFLWPMIVTNSIDKITLPVGLQSLLSPYGNNYDILIAGSCFAIIPILALFVCFQRYFIEGMTAGGVKG